jgi:hypothetical protein
MAEDMRTEAMDVIVGGIEKYSDNMEAACKLIKETMDKKSGGPWHVRVSSLGDHWRCLKLTCCPRSPRSSPVRASDSLYSTRQSTCATLSLGELGG